MILMGICLLYVSKTPISFDGDFILCVYKFIKTLNVWEEIPVPRNCSLLFLITWLDNKISVMLEYLLGYFMESLLYFHRLLEAYNILIFFRHEYNKSIVKNN